MKSILLLLNGQLTPHHVTDAAVQLAKGGAAFLHTVFIKHSPALDEYNYPFPNDLSLTRNRLTGNIIVEEEEKLLADNIRLFEDKCREAGVNFFIEPAREIKLDSLVTISTFADFIVADARQNKDDYHLADLLADAHCPVMLISPVLQQPPMLLFTYDGSPSSMYAIKTFDLLFPEWKDLPVRLLYVATTANAALPGEKYITSWMNRHYSNAQITILQGELSEELVNYTKSVPESLVIMGSFGRSPVSRFFHSSLANAIIEECACSLFIAHL